MVMWGDGMGVVVRRWVLVVFLGSAISVVCPTVNAVLVSYDFAGDISSLDDSGNLLSGDFSIGDAFTGTVSYESDSPDGSASPTYFTSPADVSMSVQLNGYSFTSRIGSVDLNSDANYIYFITGFESDPFIDLGGNPGRLMTLFLPSPLLQTDAPPTTLTGIDLASTTFRIFGDTGPGGPFFRMTGPINSLTPTNTVPEPTTTALLALGLLGAGFASKRRVH